MPLPFNEYFIIDLASYLIKQTVLIRLHDDMMPFPFRSPLLAAFVLHVVLRTGLSAVFFEQPAILVLLALIQFVLFIE